MSNAFQMYSSWITLSRCRCDLDWFFIVVDKDINAKLITLTYKSNFSSWGYITLCMDSSSYIGQHVCSKNCMPPTHLLVTAVWNADRQLLMAEGPLPSFPRSITVLLSTLLSGQPQPPPSPYIQSVTLKITKSQARVHGCAMGLHHAAFFISQEKRLNWTVHFMSVTWSQQWCALRNEGNKLYGSLLLV